MTPNPPTTPGPARWRRRFGRFARQTAGVAAVEFAFALPVLVALTLGVFDGGRAMLTFNTLEKLAKEGARFASLRGSEYTTPVDQPAVETYLTDRATGVDASKLVVTVTWPDGDNDPGSRVTVQVDYPFDGMLLPTQTLTFTRTATLSIMR